eukprot:jgi/Botrbrau1/5211/Bobra.0172s0075.1
MNAGCELPCRIPFAELSVLWEHGCAVKSSKVRLSLLRCFVRKYIGGCREHAYHVYRLLIPEADRERHRYGIRMKRLAEVLCHVCNLQAHSSAAAKKLLEWRRLSPRGSGNFVPLAVELVYKDACGLEEGSLEEQSLEVWEVNARLDELAARPGNFQEQCRILTWLLARTSPRCMAFFSYILLKDVAMRISPERILREFHPDADKLYSLTNDLALVWRQLVDPSVRLAPRGIEVGSCVRTHQPSMSTSTADAFRRMKGRPFLLEVKIDGWRMQVHRRGTEVQFWSRRGVEHGQHSGYHILGSLVRAQVSTHEIILDGELVVWNSRRKCFEPFGGLQAAIAAARQGKGAEDIVEMDGIEGLYIADPDYMPPRLKDILIVYVAFDILAYDGKTVIQDPLEKRKELLKRLIKPAPQEGLPVGTGAARGAIVALTPDEPTFAGCPFCVHGSGADDITQMFEFAIQRRLEGIVVKALDSSWIVNGRNNSWIKVKPDYVHATDIDALIIGIYNPTHGYGGRSGAQTYQYLLGLPEASDTNGIVPARWSTFCRVGTGLTRSEETEVLERLLGDAGISVLSERLVAGCRGSAPPCYRVTGHHDEWPEWWIADPQRSVVLQVQADVHPMMSRVFATGVSLRFPRVERARFDKSWKDTQTIEDLLMLVRDRRPLMGDTRQVRPKAQKLSKKLSCNTKPTVVEASQGADTSMVCPTDDLLKGIHILFLNYSVEWPKQAASELVVQHGGKVWQSWAPAVTHILAASKEGHRFAAQEKVGRPVLSITWLITCIQCGALQDPLPHDFLSLPQDILTRQYSEPGETDVFGDSYCTTVTAEQLKHLLNRKASADPHAGYVGKAAAPSELPQKQTRCRRESSVEAAYSAAASSRAGVDAKLISRGLLDPESVIFSGCRALVLPISSLEYSYAPDGLARQGLQGNEVSTTRLASALSRGEAPIDFADATASKWPSKQFVCEHEAACKSCGELHGTPCCSLSTCSASLGGGQRGGAVREGKGGARACGGGRGGGAGRATKSPDGCGQHVHATCLARASIRVLHELEQPQEYVRFPPPAMCLCRDAQVPVAHLMSTDSLCAIKEEWKDSKMGGQHEDPAKRLAGKCKEGPQVLEQYMYPSTGLQWFSTSAAFPQHENVMVGSPPAAPVPLSDACARAGMQSPTPHGTGCCPMASSDIADSMQCASSNTVGVSALRWHPTCARHRDSQRQGISVVSTGDVSEEFLPNLRSSSKAGTSSRTSLTAASRIIGKQASGGPNSPSRFSESILRSWHGNGQEDHVATSDWAPHSGQGRFNGLPTPQRRPTAVATKDLMKMGVPAGSAQLVGRLEEHRMALSRLHASGVVHQVRLGGGHASAEMSPNITHLIVTSDGLAGPFVERVHSSTCGNWLSINDMHENCCITARVQLSRTGTDGLDIPNSCKAQQRERESRGSSLICAAEGNLSSLCPRHALRGLLQGVNAERISAVCCCWVHACLCGAARVSPSICLASQPRQEDYALPPEAVAAVGLDLFPTWREHTLPYTCEQRRFPMGICLPEDPSPGPRSHRCCAAGGFLLHGSSQTEGVPECSFSPYGPKGEGCTTASAQTDGQGVSCLESNLAARQIQFHEIGASIWEKEKSTPCQKAPLQASMSELIEDTMKHPRVVDSRSSVATAECGIDDLVADPTHGIFKYGQPPDLTLFDIVLRGADSVCLR